MTDQTDFGDSDDLESPVMPAHFYFHVPFCRSKCAYCDFASYSGRDPQEVFAVFSGMEAEVRRWSVTALPGVIETVYVGGGTPSLHAVPVGRLLENVADELPLRPDAEITVEANPDSLTAFALEALLEGGANRISVGVQAFDDGVLRLLGRAHDARGARDALALVRDAGIELCVDLICGVPGQTMASWVESLEQTLDAGARHVSVYPLSIEEGTPLAAAVSGGLVPEPDADLAADMMLVAEARLSRSGIARYEVANYAAAGHESRHNSAYWLGRTYVGIGPGAHGMLDPLTAQTVGLFLSSGPLRDVARVRYANSREIVPWLMGAPVETELLSGPEVAREDVMLGMRLVRGVEATLVTAAGLDAPMRSLEADGLVQRARDRWSTTQRGWLLGNEVFRRLWTAE